MVRRTRQDMIEETRAKLIAAGRKAFGEVGYADASMDDFTAAAGLTRGALYHHFGDKKGLLAAVVAQLDAEMNAHLHAEAARAPTLWDGFVEENVGYIRMALEPEIQRIVFRDGPAVLGDPSTWPSAQSCITSITSTLRGLQADGVVAEMDPEACARLITGASAYAAQWIANAEDPAGTYECALLAFRTLLEGLRKRG